MRSIRRIIAMAITVLAVSPVAMAETVLAPPGQNVPAATRPVAGSVVKQAKQHAEGNFAPVARTTIGGQIQEAWTKAGGTAGFITMQYCATCTYKVVTREHMVTMIEVPDGEIIVQADNGDTSAFQIENRGSSRIAVKPLGYGVDSNLILNRPGFTGGCFVQMSGYFIKHIQVCIECLLSFARRCVTNGAV